MSKTDNTKLINFVFFRQKLITADFWKMVFPDKKKTYANSIQKLETIIIPEIQTFEQIKGLQIF